MHAGTNAPADIEAYIEACPEVSRAAMLQIRETIRAEVPDAEERLSYQMPTFFLHGVLAHYAAWKNHIGFYPGSAAIEAMEEKLAEYRVSKVAIQFPLSKPMPRDLIRQIIRLRVKANSERASTHP